MQEISQKISVRVSAKYPEMVQYPDEALFVDENGAIKNSYYIALMAWRENVMEQKGYLDGNMVSSKEFFSKSMKCLLADSKKENRVYSPLNVYMALGILGEITEGSTRAQILDLLGFDTVEHMRMQAKRVWNANYCNDGMTTSILGSSLWLSQNVSFKQELLNILVEYYYSSLYQGVMGSGELNETFQRWLNEQTGGLLEKQIGTVELTPKASLALATTICFHSKWRDVFRDNMTETDAFYGMEEKIFCEFMHQSNSRDYYWGDHFAALVQNFENDCVMKIILPSDGITPEELLGDNQVMQFILSSKDEWMNCKRVHVSLAIPKFDMTSNIDLIGGLKKLGIRDIFDIEKSDFLTFLKNRNSVALSQVQHTVRISIDEEGCSAAAYTVIGTIGCSVVPPDEKVDFIVNRPFLFVITGIGDLPLFAGIVYRPVI